MGSGSRAIEAKWSHRRTARLERLGVNAGEGARHVAVAQHCTAATASGPVASASTGAVTPVTTTSRATSTLGLAVVRVGRQHAAQSATPAPLRRPRAFAATSAPPCLAAEGVLDRVVRRAGGLGSVPTPRARLNRGVRRRQCDEHRDASHDSPRPTRRPREPRPPPPARGNGRAGARCGRRGPPARPAAASAQRPRHPRHGDRAHRDRRKTVCGTRNMPISASDRRPRRTAPPGLPWRPRQRLRPRAAAGTALLAVAGATNSE